MLPLNINLLETINQIIQDGIRTPYYEHIDMTDIKSKLLDYIDRRGFKVEIHNNMLCVHSAKWRYIATLHWYDNGFDISTEDQDHHIVLEIIIFSTQSILSAIAEYLDGLEIDDEEISSIDEFI